MADWAFVLDDHAGNAIVPLVNATGIQLTFVRNAAPQIAFSCGLEDDEIIKISEALASGLPRLRAYRDGILRAHLQWAPMRESAQVSEQGVTDEATMLFRGPGAALDSRWTAASVTFAATDAGQIAWELIDATNSDSPTGIAEGTIEATQNRDRTYEHKRIGEAITELTQVINGFDFEITPTVDEGADVLGLFNAYASQGQDVSDAITFDFGADTAASLRAVRRSRQLPANRARVLGADGLVAEDSDAASIAKYGLWMTLEQATDVSVQATLDAKASALLRPDPIEIVEFEPDPDLAPQPWLDYWLGYTVSVRSRWGSLAFERACRINGITINVDDNGDEASHTLAFEAAIS